MRRLLPAFLTVLGAFAVLPQPAAGQEPSDVRLTLLSQTSWNSSFDPTRDRDLVVVFRAENLGSAPIDELSIVVTLYDRVRSRSAYQDALANDPGLLVDAETLLREGPLDPGVPREFTVTFPLDSPGIDPDDSGVYPLKIELRSGFTPLAALRTPVVFLVREPEEPLALSWTFVLDHPISFRPDGIFTSTSLESSLAPGGVLATQLDTLRDLAIDPAGTGMDVVVSPVLLMQLTDMQDGYEIVDGDDIRTVAPTDDGARLAAQALEELRVVARSPAVRVGALPLTVPELPALLSGGLVRDFEVQMQRGREVVLDVLGVVPEADVLRPPGAALDETTLEQLARTGVSTLLAGPATVEASPQPLGFAGPATAALGDDGDLVAIVPEPALMERLQSPGAGENPTLLARTVLGELATIWQEQPGIPRGVAIVLSEDLALPGRFYDAFAHAVAGAPWLAPMTAGEFASAFPPDRPSTLAAPTPRGFTTTYVDEIRRTRRLISAYRSMLVDPSELPDRYDEMLLLAESRQFLSNPTPGLAFVSRVRASIGEVFRSISVETIPEITLTSSTGSGIPVTVANGAEEPLRVTVLLESASLRGSPSRDVELAPGESQTVTFDVEAQRTGRFTVFLRVLAPSGRPLFDPPREIVVASTQYNRIALVITAAAALLLLALWARRFLPRRTT